MNKILELIEIFNKTKKATFTKQEIIKIILRTAKDNVQEEKEVK